MLHVRRGALWLALVTVFAGCGGGGGGSDGAPEADTGGDHGEIPPDADVPPDVRPDGEPDGEPDGGPDGPVDTDLDLPDIHREGDGPRESRDGETGGDRHEDAPGEAFVPDGGCDPSMCSIYCVLSGYGTGECVGEACECSGTGDGGTGDGTLPDVPIDVPLDGILPDFTLPDGGEVELPEGWDITLPDGWDITLPDGFELPEGWEFSLDAGPDGTVDTGGACDFTTCNEACRAAGHTFGFCDAAGACVCF